MDIGKPQREYILEPREIPVPVKHPAIDPSTIPVPEAEPVPAEKKAA